MSLRFKLILREFIISFSLASMVSAQDLPIGHVSKASYGDWKPTGTAFQFGPASGDEWMRKLEIENGGEDIVLSSEKVENGQDDRPQGTLTSPKFTIARKYISFRVGGGNIEHHLCVNLLVDGKLVRSATGWNSDRLVATSWDVSAWQGQKAVIQIVDEASGNWGHINVSRVVQTDAPERLPVETGPLYREPLRPQFHFTARQWVMTRLNPGMQQEGWINDLNGLLYYDGEYHLFAQRWAKCWLHAVSKDLVHWAELPPAFWEEKEGSGDQSGTCVIDYDNTSGLATDKKNPAMIAFYPRWDNEGQCIAYSLDHGRSWKHYEKNPVLIHRERDPKVFWHAPSKHWVMMLYGDGQYHILTSTNLLSWNDEHHPIKDSFECPDFFELPVDGNRNQMKWVLIQGNGNYSVGTFSGTEFTEEGERHPCDMGPNFYATQSWHNTETGDGRRIQAAWMRGSNFPEMPFNQQISFPCELSLHTTPAGLRVFRKPIEAISLLHDTSGTWINRTLAAKQALRLDPSGRQFHIVADVNISEEAKLDFDIRGFHVILTSKTLESGSKPVSVQGTVKKVELLVDTGSIETFVNDGELSSTRFILPQENGISVRAEGGEATIISMTIFPLRSAWQTN